MPSYQSFLPGGASYRPLPIYKVGSTGEEALVCADYPLIQGCTCHERGSSCTVSPSCSCDVNSPVDDGGVCADALCHSCVVGDAARCLQHPGCECRRNRGEGEYFACNDLCHRHPETCRTHYTLRPREDLIEIRPVYGKGYGVFATGFISWAEEIGVYSGELVTGLELLERERRVRIDPVGALGVSEYLRRMDMALAPREVEETEAVDGVLAVHVANGTVFAMVNWEAHRVPSWLPGEDLDDQPVSTSGLVRNADVRAGPQAVSAEFYNMYTGDMRALRCCEDCDGFPDAFDYRLYVDAFRLGNFTRYINHSCEPNLDVLRVRLGSHPSALVLPLVVGGTRAGIEAGAELTIAYWEVSATTVGQRQKMKRARDVAGQQTRCDYCRCGRVSCSGWTVLPPRTALSSAGVKKSVIDRLHR